MAKQHRIRRQRWRLNAPDRGSGFALRTLLRQELDTLNGVFEHALDAVDDDEAIHIARLHLHLRIARGADLADELRSALAEQLAECVASRRLGMHGQTRPAAIQRRQGLLAFLQRGQLQWHELNADGPAMARTLAEEAEALLEAPADGWVVLRAATPTTFSAATAFFLRLLNLLQPTSIAALRIAAAHTITSTSTDPEHAAVLRMLEKLEALLPGIYERRCLQSLTLAALAAPGSAKADVVSAQLERVLGRQALRQLPFHLWPRPASTDIPSARPRLTPPASLPLLKPHGRGLPPASSPASKPAASPDALPPVLASLDDTAQDTAPGLRVHMAGLVLLHPYLPRFLDGCRIDYGDDGRIVPGALPRAAALLHRLATGREDIHEFELGMIKPLLGLLPEAPLFVAPGLVDATDAEECTALLDAAVAHWSVLRSTSGDGLRISFLQRQGLLHDNGGHWQLHVESEGFDVLLAQLPWSISLIRLPWMTKPIFTDWPTR